MKRPPRFGKRFACSPTLPMRNSISATFWPPQGRTQEGVGHWLAAIRSQPDHSGARYNYAVVLASSGDYDRALEQLEAALRSQPDFQQALELKRTLTSNTGSN